MRLSSFMSWMVWFVASALVIILSFKIINSEVGWFVFGIVVIVNLVVSAFFTDEFSEFVHFKFKVIEEDDNYAHSWTDNFRVKVLTVGYLFIPYWKEMDTDFHVFDTENVFGAKSLSSYTTNVKYRTKEQTDKAIEDYKKEAKEKRKEFFSRPEKKKIKITYRN